VSRSPGGPFENIIIITKTQKLAVHAGGCAHDGREKRNVLIVIVLLPISINFTLRSKTQRYIKVLGML
jgi:hypothetical protein